MKSILILCSILVHGLAIAQQNFLPGKIETKDGQIIEGKFHIKDKSRTPEEIEFISSKDGVSQKYKPIQLNSFEVNGKRYVSSIVEVDITPQGIHKTDYIDSRKVRIDTLFLELKVKSSISLLYHKDREYRERFFIESETGEIIELIKHKYYADVFDKETNTYERKLIVNNKYKNQLSFYLKSCPSVVEKMNKLTLKLPDLKKAIVEYNTCTGNGIDFKLKEEKVKVQFGVVAGVVSQSLKLESKGKSFEEITANELNPSINPTFGASIDIIFPMNQRRLSLNNLLIYNTFNYQSSVFMPTFSTSIYENVDYKISGSYVKLLTSIQYCFSTGPVRPFINAGVSYSYLAEFSSELNREIHNYDYTRTYEEIAIEKYKNTEVGFVFGAGLKMGDHYSAKLVFEFSDGMSKYVLLSSKMSRAYFILNYTF